MRSLPLVLLLSFGLAGCGDESSPTAPSTFPASVTLAAGQQSNVGGLLILFEKVEADSRCPVTVTCVAAGDATISVSFSTGGLSGRYEMTLTAPDKKRVTFHDYQTELVTLQPSPVAGVPTDASAYRATFTVNKTEM